MSEDFKIGAVICIICGGLVIEAICTSCDTVQ